VSSSGGDGPPEEYLAPVRYLFGAPPEQHDDEHAIEPQTAAPERRSASTDGWFVESADDTGEPSGTASGSVAGPTPGESSLHDAEPVGPVHAHPSTRSPRALRAVPQFDTEGAGGPSASDIAAATAASRVFFTASEQRVATDDSEDDQPEPTAVPAVRKASINALARKGMSSAEMVKLLEAREIDPDEASAEVERLEGAGLLDDRVLAEHLVRRLQERKGLGRSAINAELRRRQVDQAAIDEALEAVDVDDELERCMEIANKRASQLRSYDRPTAERRLSAFLMRRGYSGSVVSAAVSAALGPAGPRFR
jgi:regulatory protein